MFVDSIDIFDCHLSGVNVAKPKLSIKLVESIFLSLIRNICCGYSNDLSQRDGSFEYLNAYFV